MLTFADIPAPADAAPLLVVAPARKPRRRPVTTPWPLAEETDARRGLLAALSRVKSVTSRASAAIHFVRDAVLAECADAPRYFGTAATLLASAVTIGERLEIFHGRVRT